LGKSRLGLLENWPVGFKTFEIEQTENSGAFSVSVPWLAPGKSLIPFVDRNVTAMRKPATLEDQSGNI